MVLELLVHQAVLLHLEDQMVLANLEILGNQVVLLIPLVLVVQHYRVDQSVPMDRNHLVLL